MKRVIPQPDEIWEHYRGQRYCIVAVADHAETGREFVVYWKVGTTETFVCPIERFTSDIPYVDGITLINGKPVGEVNCLHGEEHYYVKPGTPYTTEPGPNSPPKVVPGTDMLFCRSCQDHAKLGRFRKIED